MSSTDSGRPLSRWESLRRAILLAVSRPDSAPPLGGTKNADLIRVVCTSDTHTTTPHIPEGDVLVHAGDLTTRGTFEQIQAQLDWLASMPHKYKLVIAGNHDFLLDKDFEPPVRDARERTELNWHDITYLEYASTTLTVRGRTVKVFGAPHTPQWGRWAFQYPPHVDEWAGVIPDDTGLLLCHGPPRGHLDYGHGCPHQLAEIRRQRPRLAVFGHIHEARGVELLWHDPGAEAVDRLLLGTIPGILELVLIVVAAPFVWLWRRAMRDVARGGIPQGSTLLVNASSLDQFKVRPGNEGAGMVVYL